MERIDKVVGDIVAMFALSSGGQAGGAGSLGGVASLTRSSDKDQEI